ncbi:hypothetical protein FE257_005596 [Aspergillus nanangensis]|uniref:Wax synthase domain-containing protein n=1 Tax=Aspergillus nanangensis TaxID=2582783 RepID=A0AAD4CQA6_ASPNN|nr:hypothetical protein FE257_005596 [Aspergillus nanangensis]
MGFFPPSIVASIEATSQYCLISLILGLAATFTSATSPLRPPAIAAILGLAISIQNLIVHQAAHIPVILRGSVALGGWVQVANSLDILVYRRITYAEHVQWTKGRRISLPYPRIWFALSIPHNFRRIGTKWQITPVYDFVQGKIPARREFLRQRFRSIVLIGGAVGFFLQICFYLDCIPRWNDLRFALAHGRLFHLDLSWPSLLTQAILSFSLLVSMFLLQRAVYATLAITAVALHLSSPADWPPFQASAREAWSIRRFWGQFWHQLFRSFLSSNAEVIISAIPFRLHKTTSRYLRYFLCFLVSGLIHHFFDLAIGISLHDTGALLTFTVQPVAFAVEDMAQYLSRRYMVLTGNTVAKRVLGYVWVIIFSCWSLRPWIYQVARRALEAAEPITSTRVLA